MNDPILTTPHYNVTVHCSPGPKQIVGYFYPNGYLGACVEQWRKPYCEAAYNSAVRRAKRNGRTILQKAETLYSILSK